MDSGSTHNFMDAAIVQRLGCQLEDCTLVTVVVADGNRMQCNQVCVCVGMAWRMQGQEFKTDLLLLPLDGC